MLLKAYIKKMLSLFLFVIIWYFRRSNFVEISQILALSTKMSQHKRVDLAQTTKELTKLDTAKRNFIYNQNPSRTSTDPVNLCVKEA